MNVRFCLLAHRAITNSQAEDEMRLLKQKMRRGRVRSYVISSNKMRILLIYYACKIVQYVNIIRH